MFTFASQIYTYELHSNITYELHSKIIGLIKWVLLTLASSFCCARWPTANQPARRTHMSDYINPYITLMDLLLLRSQLYLWGSPFLVEVFRTWPSLIQQKRSSHFVFMDGACPVCFSCRHSPAKDMSRSFESMRWNAYVLKLGLTLIQ